MADITVYAPALTSPNNAATDQMPDVLLDWDAVVGEIGLHYELQISDNENFADPEIYMTEATSYNAFELMFGAMYYWKVRAIDNTGTSNWSEARSFSVLSVAELSRPKDEDDDQDINVQLKWDKLTGVTYYECELDTTPDFNSPQYQLFEIPWDDLSNFADTEFLYFEQIYYWRVRAKHSKDVMDWSETWSFETLIDFKQKKPNNNATDRMPDVELKWEEVEGVNGYFYQLDTDPDFIHPVTYQTQGYEILADTLLFGEKYYWRVLAYHFYDSTQWMNETPRNFTVIDEVFLDKPDDEEVNVVIYPLFIWKSIDAVLSYEIQVDVSEEFTNPMIKTISADANESYIEHEWRAPALDSTVTYYWRVNATSSSDVSGWSEVWSFLVGAIGIDDPVLNEKNIEIFPNPADGPIYIKMNNDRQTNIKIKIIDLLGQEVYGGDINCQEGVTTTQIDTDFLSNGIYMIQLKNGTSSFTRKLVIKH